MNKNPINVLVVDDHAMVREGLHLVLDSKPDIGVVGEASSGPEAISMVRERRPDVVLMDVTMPGMSGIEATQAIIAMDLGTRVLGLTVHENQEYFFRMLAAGASGYVLKGATSAELVEAIRSVYGGGVHLTPSLAGLLVGEYLRYRGQGIGSGGSGLTAREVEVLRVTGQGLTNQEVAEALHLSVYTVQTHLTHIMRKLGLGNRQHLIKYAVQKGYLDSS